MAESGSFRTSLNGFHKKDVLDYIDAMQSQHAGELQQSKSETAQMRQALTAQETYVNELKLKIDELEKESAALRDENKALKQHREDTDRVTADFRRLLQEADILRLEKQELSARLADMQVRMASVKELEEQIQALNEQLSRKAAEREEEITRERAAALQMGSLRAEKENLAEQLTRANAQLQEAGQKISSFQETNRRYDNLVGEVGSFIMELHSMGQRFLETAYKRSDSCLKAVESSVSSLSAQLTEARAQVGQARQELLDHGALAGLRLDELVQALEESSETIANPKKADE